MTTTTMGGFDEEDEGNLLTRDGELGQSRGSAMSRSSRGRNKKPSLMRSISSFMGIGGNAVVTVMTSDGRVT